MNVIELSQWRSDEWGYSHDKEAHKLEQVKIARTRARTAVTLAPRPIEEPVAVHVPGRLLPSAGKILVRDNGKLDYRVRRAGMWISLPLIAFQHGGDA